MNSNRERIRRQRIATQERWALRKNNEAVARLVARGSSPERIDWDAIANQARRS